MYHLTVQLGAELHDDDDGDAAPPEETGRAAYELKKKRETEERRRARRARELEDRIAKLRRERDEIMRLLDAEAPPDMADLTRKFDAIEQELTAAEADEAALRETSEAAEAR